MYSLLQLSVLLSASVFCVVTSETISLRLVSGQNEREGNIYVKRGSDWGLVCDDDWDLNAGNVVCRQLGFSKAIQVTSFNKFHSDKTEKIFLDDVKCHGHENNLGECKHREWLTSNCHAGEAAGVVCDGTDALVLNNLPTASHSTEDNLEHKKLEITVQKINEIPAELEASTAKPELTTTTNILRIPQTGRSNYSSRTLEILARAHRLLSGELDSEESAAIHSDEDEEAVKMHVDEHRLVSSLSSQPDADTDHTSALEGLSGSLDLSVDGAPAAGPVIPPQGYEVPETDMKKIDELIESMRYKSDQPLTPPAKPYRVEIAGGRRANEGYVRVTLDNGQTGTICSDNWGIYEAMVVCRQTGNQQAERSTLIDYFNARNEDKVIYEVNCDGHEKSIADCEYKLMDRHGVKCSKPVNVAGVVCTSAKLPDLMPNIWALQSSLFVEDKPLYSLTCAMEENCLSSSAYNARAASSPFGFSSSFGGFGAGPTRRLLRFSSNIYNNGTADFRPHQHRSSWEWHSCHQHYHSMNSFSHYDIVDSHGNRVAEGHKASFCLEDVECDWPHRKKFSCRGFADQGISVGCADVYKYDIDCQWVDITDLSPGAYVFKLNVNPNLSVPELSYDNNCAICELTYNGYSAKLSNCVLSRG